MRLNKTATIQARLDPSLKKKGDMILKKIGITASQAVNAMYAQIVLQKGLPFENPTAKAIGTTGLSGRKPGPHFYTTTCVSDFSYVSCVQASHLFLLQPHNTYVIELSKNLYGRLHKRPIHIT